MIIRLLKRGKQILRELRQEEVFRRRRAFVRCLGPRRAAGMLLGKAADILTGYRTALYKRQMERFCRESFGDIARACEERSAAVSPAPEQPIPVFCLWWDGLEGAPECVVRCVASHRQWLKAPRFDYVLLTRENVGDYVELPEEIRRRFEAGRMSLTHLSDYIRARLLYRYGGLWIDSTLLVTGPFGEAFFSLPFYTNKKFTYARNNRRLIPAGRYTCYFMKAEPGSPLFDFVAGSFERYWQRYDEMFEYYLLDYLIHTAGSLIPSVGAMIDAVPENNRRVFDLYEMRNAPWDSDAVSALLQENVIHKFSYKDVYRLQDENGAPTVWSVLLSESETT